MILSEIKQRWQIVVDRQISGERRLFALLEAVFMPMSFLSLLGLILLPILRRLGVSVPAWVQGPLLTILVSAAIGYITNWIAIEMLFKPYYPTLKHPFALMTCGYWRQGLVPKNKDEIAVVMGEQVATRLLRPEAIADDLCSMVGGVLRNPQVVASIRAGVQGLITTHNREIVALLAPRIEQALATEIDRVVTVEKVEEFWADHVEPKLQAPETREEIAHIMIVALESRAPDLAAKTKPLVVSAISSYIQEKGGLVGSTLAPLTEKIADCIVSRNTLEQGLLNWLESPETVPGIRDELLHFTKSISDYLKSDSSTAKVDAFIAEFRLAFKVYVRTYIETNLPDASGRLLASESFWNGIQDMIPKIQPELERLIRTEGTPLIMEKLDIKGRIKSAVDKMDVAEFHGMINEVAAQHLGAIQVLGYLLGAVAGILMALI